MSSIMNGYMNSIERENDIFERSIEIEYNKISLMIEAYRNKLENDYLLAEQKIMMENGTYEDLTYLYTEANNEADKNKEGIFARIKKFIQGIIERIKNFFRGGDENIEGNASAIYDEIAKQCNSIVDLFNNVKNAVLQGKWGEALKLLANGTATLVVFKIGKDAVDATAKKAEEKIIFYSKKAVNRIKKIFNKTSDNLTTITNEIEKKAESSKDDNAPSLLNEVAKHLGKGVSFLTGKFNELKKALTKNNQSEQQEQKEETPNEKSSGEQSQQQDDTQTNTGTRNKKTMKLKGKLTGNNKAYLRNKNSKSASSGSNSETPNGKSSGEQSQQQEQKEETPTNTSTEDDSGNDEEATREAKDAINRINKAKEKAMPELMNRCKSAIQTLKKNHKDKINPRDSKRIAGINRIMINYNNKKIDADRAYNYLYSALDELYEIIDKVCTEKQKRAQRNKIRDFKAKYNEAGTINESYYLYYDEDEYDIYNEYVEISDYDYDEIDRLFTERSGDPLVDELLDILNDF